MTIARGWLGLNPWQRRLIAFACILSVGLGAAGHYVSSHYRIAFDQQTIRCLPWWSYLIVLGVVPERYDLVAFESGTAQPMFPAGTVLVKRLVGVPGDRIEVEAGEVRVNGEILAYLSHEVLAQLGRSSFDFDARFVLRDGEYFVLGEAPLSYDSRYWGPVHRADVIGRARGVL